MSFVKKRDILGPVKVALLGMVYTFRTQRHMRFHLYVVLIVTVLGVFLNLRLREMLILLFVISLVLVAEMFNSAIEATVDLVQPTYHPMAKFAKDIAAGAVLITTIIALVVVLWPYARRAAARLHATPHRSDEALCAPPDAPARIDRFQIFRTCAERRWRRRFSSA